MSSNDAVTTLEEYILLENNVNEIEIEVVNVIEYSRSSSVSISSSRILTDSNKVILIRVSNEI